MYTINNARVELFGNGKISYVSAKMSDQTVETLKEIGRGKMLKHSKDSSLLKYDLMYGQTVFLDTED